MTTHSMPIAEAQAVAAANAKVLRYNASGRVRGDQHCGTSGFVNYMPTFDGVRAAKAEVFRDYPGAVIVDGIDDWLSPACGSPQLLVRLFNLRLLARFHAGISGITSSGIVLSAAEFERFTAEYHAAFDYDVGRWLHIEREADADASAAATGAQSATKE